MNRDLTINQDSYKSIGSISEGSYKDSGSRFLSIAYPCNRVEEANEILASLKKKYHDATHICYAYRFGISGDIWRANDDGEPSSTAGRPILGEILSSELSDILVVVVRWFGGIKLGVPGLIKAYKSAAADAISNATIITKLASTPHCIIFSYPMADKILKELKKNGIEIKNKIFDIECRVIAEIPNSKIDYIINILQKIPDTKVEKSEQ